MKKKFRWEKRFRFFIWGGIILLILLNIGHVKLAFNYIMGSYYQNIKQDYSQSVKYYEKVFSNTKMLESIDNDFFFSAYGYGIIKNYQKNPKGKLKEINMILEKYPDNIYLDFINKSYAYKDMQNLDRLSLLCLKDHDLNNLSQKVISFYLDKGLLKKNWLKLSIHFLRWQNNLELAQKFQAAFKKKFNEEFIFAVSSDNPPSFSLSDILYTYLSHELEDTREKIKKVNDNLQNIKREVEIELKKNRIYVQIKERSKKLNISVNNLKKTYKIGYPKLKNAIEELENFNHKMAKIFQDTLDSIRRKYHRLQSSLQQKNDLLYRNLQQIIPENQKPAQMVQTKQLLIEKLILPKGSIIGTNKLKLLNGNGQEIIFYQDFSTVYWQDDFQFKDWSLQKEYSRGSYTGGIDRLNYRMICFNSSKQANKYPSCAGLWTKQAFQVNKGIYLIEFTYKTVFNTCEPSFSQWYGRYEKKLPHTDNNWAKVVYILVVDSYSPLKRIKPWIRIYQPGICLINNFKIIHISKISSYNFQELLIVSRFAE